MNTLRDSHWGGTLYASIGLLLSVLVFFAFRRFNTAHSRVRSTLRISYSSSYYLVAAFAITALGSYKAANTSTYIEIAKWSQLASIVGQVSLLWLVARLTRAVPKPAVAFLTTAFVLAVAMHIISVSGLFLSYFGEIHLSLVYGLDWILPARVPFHIWQLPVNLTNVAAFIVVGVACLGQYRRGERMQATLAAVLVIVVLGENLHDMYFADTIYLAPLGLLLMLAVFLFAPQDLAPNASVDSEEPVGGIPSGGGSTREFLSQTSSAGLMPADQSPLSGLFMALFLVSAAQAFSWGGLTSVIILLALLGMGHATLSVLFRAGSGVEMRNLAILALVIIAIPQLAGIVDAVSGISNPVIVEANKLLHGPLRDWLWITGLLLLLTAFSLSGLEAGAARERLMLEHRELLMQVAERRHAEEALSISERRFRRLVENSTDLVVILSQDGTIRDIGASVERILGYTPEELAGRPVAAYCHPDDLPRLARALKSASPAQGSVQSVEIRILLRDGSWRVIESISDLQFDPVLNGIIVNARDITERKHMEELFRSARTDERQRIRHDLHDTVGQDLAGLLCMTGSLAMELQQSSRPLADQANAIVEGVQRTMEDVKRAILGIAPIEMHPRGLEVALEQLAERLRNSHRMDIGFECDSATPIDDYGVATQLFLIAQEALTNAVKHARARKIVVSLASSRDRVLLSVTDDGTGIDEPTSDSKGLGLQTMRSRAAAIGAWLRISGQVGKGTQVKCELIKELHGDDRAGKGLHDFAI